MLVQTETSIATIRAGGSRPPVADVNATSVQVTALQAKIRVLETQYEQIQKDAARIAAVETEIQELRRRKEIEEQNYRYFSESREQAKIDEAFGAGQVNNIGIVQSPTPYWNNKETLKIAGGTLAVFLSLGIGWAFLMELFLDQSIKRPVDIKRQPRHPPLLHPRYAKPSLPKASQKGREAGNSRSGEEGQGQAIQR